MSRHLLPTADDMVRVRDIVDRRNTDSMFRKFGSCNLTCAGYLAISAAEEDLNRLKRLLDLLPEENVYNQIFYELSVSDSSSPFALAVAEGNVRAVHLFLNKVWSFPINFESQSWASRKMVYLIMNIPAEMWSLDNFRLAVVNFARYYRNLCGEERFDELTRMISDPELLLRAKSLQWCASRMNEIRNSKNKIIDFRKELLRSIWDEMIHSLRENTPMSALKKRISYVFSGGIERSREGIRDDYTVKRFLTISRKDESAEYIDEILRVAMEFPILVADEGADSPTEMDGLRALLQKVSPESDLVKEIPLSFLSRYGTTEQQAVAKFVKFADNSEDPNFYANPVKMDMCFQLLQQIFQQQSLSPWIWRYGLVSENWSEVIIKILNDGELCEKFVKVLIQVIQNQDPKWWLPILQFKGGPLLSHVKDYDSKLTLLKAAIARGEQLADQADIDQLWKNIIAAFSVWTNYFILKNPRVDGLREFILQESPVSFRVCLLSRLGDVTFFSNMGHLDRLIRSIPASERVAPYQAYAASKFKKTGILFDWLFLLPDEEQAKIFNENDWLVSVGNRSYLNKISRSVFVLWLKEKGIDVAQKCLGHKAAIDQFIRLYRLLDSISEYNPKKPSLIASPEEKKIYEAKMYMKRRIMRELKIIFNMPVYETSEGKQVCRFDPTNKPYDDATIAARIRSLRFFLYQIKSEKKDWNRANKGEKSALRPILDDLVAELGVGKSILFFGFSTLQSNIETLLLIAERLPSELPKALENHLAQETFAHLVKEGHPMALLIPKMLTEGDRDRLLPTYASLPDSDPQAGGGGVKSEVANQVVAEQPVPEAETDGQSDQGGVDQATVSKADDEAAESDGFVMVEAGGGSHAGDDDMPESRASSGIKHHDPAKWMSQIALAERIWDERGKRFEEKKAQDAEAARLQREQHEAALDVGNGGGAAKPEVATAESPTAVTQLSVFVKLANQLTGRRQEPEVAAADQELVTEGGSEVVNHDGIFDPFGTGSNNAGL